MDGQNLHERMIYLKKIFIPLFIFLLLTGCSQNIDRTKEDLFQYKGSKVGNNSAVSNIANNLLNGKKLASLELSTSKKPYGIILNYKNIAVADLESEYKLTALYNASFFFALVPNVEWITFRFDEVEYKVTKEELQNWYGEDLSQYDNEDELDSLVQNHLKNIDSIIKE